MADDFTLKFGSNAKQFAKDLDADLGRILANIREITQAVGLIDQATAKRNTGTNPLTEQLSKSATEIQTFAGEIRADIGNTSIAIASAAKAIGAMQASIQGLLNLFQNVDRTATETGANVERGRRRANDRVAGLRQRFSESEKDPDTVLGKIGTGDPFSRRTSGLTEGIKRLGETADRAGTLARDSAVGISALREALQNMNRALPGAVGTVEGVGAGGQISLTSDVIVGLANAIRENTTAVRGDTLAEASNTEATVRQTAAAEKPPRFQTLTERDLDTPARRGGFVLPSGEQRNVSPTSPRTDESFRQLFARLDANLLAERRVLDGVQTTEATTDRLIGLLGRTEVNRLRNTDKVIEPERFERFRVANKGLGEADLAGIPAALRDLARFEQERDTALLGLIRERLSQDPLETFAGFSGDIKRLVSKLDEFIVRQVNSRDDLLEKGRLGESRFRVAGDPTFQAPENLEQARRGAQVRQFLRDDLQEFLAGRGATRGARTDADSRDSEGRAIGLRARQRDLEKTAATEAELAAQKKARAAQIERQQTETQIALLERRRRSLQGLINDLNGLKTQRQSGQSVASEDEKAVRTAVASTLDALVSELRGQVGRLEARGKAIDTSLDDGPDARQSALRRKQQIDRELPALAARLQAAQEDARVAIETTRVDEQLLTARARLNRLTGRLEPLLARQAALAAEAASLEDRANSGDVPARQARQAAAQTALEEAQREEIAAMAATTKGQQKVEQRRAQLAAAAEGDEAQQSERRRQLIQAEGFLATSERRLARATEVRTQAMESLGRLRIPQSDQERTDLRSQAGQARAQSAQLQPEIDALAPEIAQKNAEIKAALDKELAAKKKVVDIEAQIFSLGQQRVILEERLNRDVNLDAAQQKKLRDDRASVDKRKAALLAQLKVLDPKTQEGNFRPDEQLLAALEAGDRRAAQGLEKLGRAAERAAEKTAATTTTVAKSDKRVGSSQKAAAEDRNVRAVEDDTQSLKNKVSAQRREVRALERRAAKAEVVLANDDASEKAKKSATNRLNFATQRLEKARTRLASLEETTATSGGSGNGGGRRGTGGSGSGSDLPRGNGNVVDVRVVAISADAARAIRGTTPRAPAGDAQQDAATPRLNERSRTAANARQTLATLGQIDEEVAASGQRALNAAIEAGTDATKAAQALEQRMLAALKIVDALRAKGLRSDAAIRIASDSVGFGRRTDERAQFAQLARTTIDLSRSKAEARDLQKTFDSLENGIKQDLLRIQKNINSGLIPNNVATQELVQAYRQFISSPLISATEATSARVKRLFGQMFNLPPGVVSDVARTVGRINAQMDAIGGDAGSRFANGFQRFIDKTIRAGSFFSVRSLAGSFVFGLENIFREAFSTALNAETEFVRVEDALNSVNQSAVGLKGEFQDLSRELGIPLDDIQRSASQLVGVFNDRESLIDATRTVGQLQIISNGALNAEEAFKSLTAVASSFGLQGSQGLQHITDVATALQNTLGTNVEDTLEGVSRLSSVAAQFGLSLERISALTATASKFSGQSGQAVSEQLGRVLALFNTPKVQSLLSSSLKGVTVAQFSTETGTGDAIVSLVKQFNDLDVAQKNAILQALGGQRQFAILGAILNNSEEALRAMTAAEDSNGAANARVQKVMGTLRKEIDQLKASLVTLVNALADAGLFGALEAVAKATNGLLSGISSLVKTFNDLTSNPVLSFLKTLTVSILLMAAAWKAARAGANFFRRDVATGVADASARVASGATQVRPPTPGAGPLAPTTGNISRVEFEARGASQALRNASQSVTSLGLAGRATGGLLNRSAGGLDNLGKAASNVGRRASDLNNRFEGLSASGAALDGAILGVTLVMSGYLTLLAREKSIRESIAQTVADRQDTSDPKTAIEKKQEEVDKLLKEAKDAQSGFFGTLGVGFQGIVDVIKASSKGGFKTKAALDRALGHGTSLDDVKAFNKAFEKFQSDADAAFKATPDTGKAQLSGKLQKELNKQADDLIALIGENPIAQAQALATITGLLGDIKTRGDETKVVIQGFGKVISVTQDQLDSISGLVDALASLNRGQLAGQADTIASVISQTDLGKNPQIRSLIQALANPANTTAQKERIKAQIFAAMAAFQKQIAETSADAKEASDAMLRSLQFAGEASAALQAAQDAKFETIRRRAENQVALGQNNRAVNSFATAILQNRQNAQNLDRGSEEFAQAVETDKELRKALAEALFADALAAAKADEANAKTDAGKQAAQNAINTIELKIAEQANDIPGLLGLIADAQRRLALKREKDSARSAIAATPPDVSPAVTSAIEKLRASLGLKDPTPENIRTIRVNEAALALAVARAGEAAAAEAVAFQGEIGLFNKSLIAAGRKTAAAAAALGEAQKLPKIKVPKLDFPNQPAVPQAEIGDLQNTAAGGNDAKEKNDLEEQIRQARAAARIAGIRNPLAKLQAQLNETLRQEKVARQQGRKGLPEYYRLVAEEKGLRQQISDALFAVATAEKSLAIALAEAAGQTVRAARLRLREARREARRATRLFGAGSAEALAAQQQVIQLQASARDAVLQDQLDGIDFNIEFNKITAQQAIKQLQDILTQKDLTKQQRRDLLRRIKSIQDEIDSSNEGQFNIGDILLPTIYEVRRSAKAAKAGVNYQETNNTTNNVQISGADLAKVTALITSLLGRTATGRSGTTTGKV